MLRIVIFLTKFSDMSNLFEAANINVRAVSKKQTKDFGLLLKQGKVTISIKALTKVYFFFLSFDRGIKKGSVFMEIQ